MLLDVSRQKVLDAPCFHAYGTVYIDRVGARQHIEGYEMYKTATDLLCLSSLVCLFP